jgi:hypothetical protein
MFITSDRKSLRHAPRRAKISITSAGAKTRCGSITDGGESVDTLILQYRMITKGYFLS